MKKQVMVRAWQIIKAAVAEFGGKCRDYSFSEALRIAWQEVKMEEHEQIITKQHLINRINAIIANSAQSDSTEMFAKVSDWQNYGKSRTYFSIIERGTTRASKYFREKKYGYLDNVTGEYVPEKYGNLMDNFTFSGARF